MRKPLWCYVGLHRWQRLRTADGGWFNRCRGCRKFKDIPGAHAGKWFGRGSGYS
jgi:hypothetical protein